MVKILIDFAVCVEIRQLVLIFNESLNDYANTKSDQEGFKKSC